MRIRPDRERLAAAAFRSHDNPGIQRKHSGCIGQQRVNVELDHAFERRHELRQLDERQRNRIEIRRRPAAAERTVSDYLEYDHRRLDSILPAVLQDIDNGDCAGAAARFAEFACGLNHHIEAEEQILFPSFEERTGMRTGPTMVMRAEHVEIRRAMRQVGDALAAGDSQNARSALAGLVDALSEHNMKEEHVLYPMTDEANAPGERDALVKKMQAL